MKLQNNIENPAGAFAATEEDPEQVRLTSFSHGSGCGCKLSPPVLEEVLKSNLTFPDEERLLVGNHTKDDAAVYDLGEGQALISTTDFFMPIVDSPFDFGRIASANALSDVYAMGGRPVLALSILGWPLGKIPPNVARRVIEGARTVCAEAGVSLAGGHSIDCPEPLFGLAVNGIAPIEHIKRNDGARVGDLLFLTKPLGIGILSTAEKKGLLLPEHRGLASSWMLRLNKLGGELGSWPQVHAMTDVTGFGLGGHLSELCAAGGLSAVLDFESIPLLPGLDHYVKCKCVPGGMERNWLSYGDKIRGTDEYRKVFLGDPQTSGGLLVAVAPEGRDAFCALLEENGLGDFTTPLGRLEEARGDGVLIEVR